MTITFATVNSRLRNIERSIIGAGAALDRDERHQAGGGRRQQGDERGDPQP